MILETVYFRRCTFYFSLRSRFLDQDPSTFTELFHFFKAPFSPIKNLQKTNLNPNHTFKKPRKKKKPQPLYQDQYQLLTFYLDQPPSKISKNTPTPLTLYQNRDNTPTHPPLPTPHFFYNQLYNLNNKYIYNKKGYRVISGCWCEWGVLCIYYKLARCD